MTFKEYSKDGERADKLCLDGSYNEAGMIYMKLFNELKTNKNVDIFIISKITLGLLINTIKGGDKEQGFAIWTKEPDDGLFGIGIYGLESAQVNLHDTIIYQMISAYFHSISSQDKDTSAENVNRYMSGVSQYCLEKEPDLLAMVICNWKLYLIEIFELLIPSEYTEEIDKIEKKMKKTIPLGKVDFPLPSKWAIDWDAEESVV